MSPTVVHTCRYGPADREEAYYRYLPVPVPRPAPGLSVRLRYDRSQAVIDLGLWGPGGPGDFRGWSGGARCDVVVGPGGATPGYLPGPVGPGEWLVALGLYRVPPGGVEVTVEAGIGPSPLPPSAPEPPVPAVPAGPASRPPASPGRRWVAGDLHAHSHHSDGQHPLSGLAVLARTAGLDFLAVTDHNTVSHHPALPGTGRRYGVTLIPGQELTTTEGHANCLGDVGWVDFRRGADEWSGHIAATGGLLSLNHPVHPDYGWHRSLRRPADLVEVWHWTWDRRVPSEAVAWWRASGAGTAVGGSDYHRPGDSPPGTPTTWVEVESDGGTGPPEPAQVLAGLRAGRVAVSAGPAGPVLVRLGDEVIACGADGATLRDEEGGAWPVRGPRARVRGPAGMCRLDDGAGRVLALSN